VQTIDEIITATYEIKKSTFLSFLCPVSEFKALHERLKAEHPKAAHIVWAYRELNGYGQVVENQSDDGEPKGTSGQPSLNALRGVELIDAGVLIVRYFGGIKLGTGGLVRAYAAAVNAAIGAAQLSGRLVKFEIKSPCIFFVPFVLNARFEHYFEKRNLAFLREFNEEGAIWRAKFNGGEFDEFYAFANAFEREGFKFYAIALSAKGEIYNETF